MILKVFLVFILFTSISSDGTSLSCLTQKGVYKLANVNSLLPILQTQSYNGNFLTCTGLCLDYDICYATYVQAYDERCHIFADERYLEYGRLEMKLVEGSIWIMQRTCPEQYTLLANGCFYLNQAASDWDSARAVCRNMHANGRLAEFHSEPEMRTVVEHLRNKGVVFGFWVGSKRNSSTAIWDMTRKNVSTTLMLDPNQSYPSGAEDVCYVLLPTDVKLLFLDCIVLLPYLCETF